MISEMPEVRVLLAVDPPLYGKQLQQQLSISPLVKVVGRTSRPSETVVMAGELRAEVVVLSGEENDSMPRVCTHLFCEFPDIVVVAIAPNGQHALVFRRSVSAERIEGNLEQKLRQVLSGACSIEQRKGSRS